MNLEVNKDEERNDGKVSVVAKYFSDFFFFKIKNVSKKNVEYSIKIGGVTNLKILLPMKDPLNWTLKLAPGETKLVKYKTAVAGSESGLDGYSELSKFV